jgi:hypothetical protein
VVVGAGPLAVGVVAVAVAVGTEGRLTVAGEGGADASTAAVSDAVSVCGSPAVFA